MSFPCRTSSTNDLSVGRSVVKIAVFLGSTPATRPERRILCIADLDCPETLDRLAGLAQDIVHLAPPPRAGIRDTRTANLVRALARGRSLPQRVVYISTSGIYGDCGGVLVDETRPAHPMTDRAMRRVDAERVLRSWGAETGVHVSILRVPGIYAAERLPIERLRKSTPVLRDMVRRMRMHKASTADD